MTAGKPDKAEKQPERTVASMKVLSDIRGLISGAREEPKAAEAAKPKQAASDARVARLEKQIAGYQDQVRRQQEELDRLKSERDELAAKLASASKSGGKAERPAQNGDEIADLEQRKTELMSALSEVEGILLIKTQDLLRRLANLYEEAGQSGFAQELRRGRNGLQDPENLASFLRAFLRQ